MPSGPPELHEKWCARDPEGRGDMAAMGHLEAAGYKLGRDWHWTLPSPDHVPTAEELSALDYLVLEWDYGWLAPSSNKGLPA